MKDGLLLNFDPYATAYGWDQWPARQFEAVRVDDDVQARARADHRVARPEPSTVGVFYNKDQAAQIGMTAPPKTVEEFDALLAKAKAAGLQPIMEWNASTSGGGLAFPLQNLMAAYGDHSTINDWVFLKEGATIETPEFLQATQKLDEWIKKGYFPRTSTRSSTPTPRGGSARARACSPSTATGRTPAMTRTSPARLASSPSSERRAASPQA